MLSMVVVSIQQVVYSTIIGNSMNIARQQCTINIILSMFAKMLPGSGNCDNSHQRAAEEPVDQARVLPGAAGVDLLDSIVGR